VLATEPESRAALLGLAQTLEAEKKPEAAAAYQDYLKVQPDDTAAQQRLVHILIANQKFDEALVEMEKDAERRSSRLSNR
jgi:predicted negative regulator of RcsB-dependent stress response